MTSVSRNGHLIDFISALLKFGLSGRELNRSKSAQTAGIPRRGAASLPQNSSAYCVQCTACSPQRTCVLRPAPQRSASQRPALRLQRLATRWLRAQRRSCPQRTLFSHRSHGVDCHAQRSSGGGSSSSFSPSASMAHHWPPTIMECSPMACSSQPVQTSARPSSKGVAKSN